MRPPHRPESMHETRLRGIRMHTWLGVPLLTLLAGCSMAETPISQDAFAAKVDSLLAGKDSIVVPASALTDFPWQTLCFERHDALQLHFRGEGDEQVLSLPYERFFVDEGHVARSLEDECITPDDRILVKKKYPGYEGPIEFQKADQGD